jgi:1-acyl-sn-glycerol-3-phosphate acyltransferase
VTDRIYRLTNFLVRNQLRTRAAWEIQGVEGVPPMGPLIIVANHLSNLDGSLLAASIPRRIYFIAKRSLFKPVVSALLRQYGVYPVDGDGGGYRAFLWAREHLNQDHAVALLPEARRNPGGMQRASPGIALVALRTQAAILPVGITGTQRLGAMWRVAFPVGELTVRIGQPFTLPDIQGHLKRPQLQSLADMVMQRVAALLPEEYRGVYGVKPAEQPAASSAGA